MIKTKQPIQIIQIFFPFGVGDGGVGGEGGEGGVGAGMNGFKPTSRISLPMYGWYIVLRPR
jgi:hypothetical protein